MICCYAPQRLAIVDLLNRMGLTTLHASMTTQIRSASDAMYLKGQAGGTWIEIDGHAGTIPDDIRREIALQGMMTMVLSDALLRARRSRAL